MKNLIYLIILTFHFNANAYNTSSSYEDGYMILNGSIDATIINATEDLDCGNGTINLGLTISNGTMERWDKL